MKASLIHCACIIFFALAGLHTQAAEKRKVLVDRVLATELYETANLQRNYAGWHASMSKMLMNYQPVLPDDVFNKLQTRFQALSSQRRYKRRTIRALRAGLDDTQVRVVQKWYAADGGLLSRQERVLSASYRPDQPLNEWLENQRLSQARTDVLLELIKVTDAVNQSADFIVQSALSMAVLVSNHLPDNQKLNINLIEERLQKQGVAISEELGRVSLARYAWVYQDVSDDLLKQYLAFSKTPDAKAWFQVVNQAQAQILLSSYGL